MASCTHCGAELTVGSRFCASCGRPATDSGAGARRMSQESIESGEQRLLEALRSATLGNYEILGEIGRGGMAVVFLAYDVALERKVAIKVMSPALFMMDPSIQARFKREARTAAALSHPHVIPVYAVKEGADLVYFVMKYIEGRALDSVIAEVERLPIPVVATILQQAGSALGYAHRKGVVHRDVKPANIMLDEEGWVIVTDLGIAKVAEGEALTATGGVVGTPAYMSPEQCQGLEIDGATDQYALGIVAYEMLAGHPPFQGESMVNLIYDHCHTEPVPVSELRTDCPPGLATTVMRMLAKKPQDRFASIDEAITSIGPIEHTPDDTRTQILTFVQSAPTTTEQLIEKFRTPGSAITPTPSTTAPPSSSSPTPMTAAPVATEARDGAAARKWAAIGIPAVAVAAVFGWFLLRGAGTPSPTDRAVSDPVAATPATPSESSPSTIEITPLDVRLLVGAETSLAATARDAAGDVIDASIVWESRDPSIATVQDGVVTALSAGTARLIARSGPASASVTVEVQTPAPATASGTPSPVRIQVSPASLRVSVGESSTLQARVLDQSGRTMSGQRVTWRSTAPTVATVAPGGQVQPVAPGTAILLAEAAGLTATATVTVTAAPVAAVEIAPRTVTIRAGDATLLQATTRDDAGNALANRDLRWESSNPNVARVSTGGRVTGVGPGTVRITASSDGVRGEATVTVEDVATPAPATPVPAEPEPVADPRPLILAEVERYREAIASQDVAQLKRVYPDMPVNQEQAWRDFFGGVTDLRAAFNDVDLEISGDRATARIDATYAFRAGRPQSQVTTIVIELTRVADRWLITAVR